MLWRLVGILKVLEMKWVIRKVILIGVCLVDVKRFANWRRGFMWPWLG